VEPVEPVELVPTALRVAGDIAARGPRAHAAILRALAGGRPTARSWRSRPALAAIATSGAEAAEGVAAFKPAAPPAFPRSERRA